MVLNINEEKKGDHAMDLDFVINVQMKDIKRSKAVIIIGILNRVADEVNDGATSGKCFDGNDNVVGMWWSDGPQGKDFDGNNSHKPCVTDQAMGG